MHAQEDAQHAQDWQRVADSCTRYLLSSMAHGSTGLLPDFGVWDAAAGSYRAPAGRVLEKDEDKLYFWNSCRWDPVLVSCFLLLVSCCRIFTPGFVAKQHDSRKSWTGQRQSAACTGVIKCARPGVASQQGQAGCMITRLHLTLP